MYKDVVSSVLIEHCNKVQVLIVASSDICKCTVDVDLVKEALQAYQIDDGERRAKVEAPAPVPMTSGYRLSQVNQPARGCFAACVSCMS